MALFRRLLILDCGFHRPDTLLVTILGHWLLAASSSLTVIRPNMTADSHLSLPPILVHIMANVHHDDT